MRVAFVGWLGIVFVLGAIGRATAGTVDVSGNPGADGTPGVEGDPATDGTDGQDGEAAIADLMGRSRSAGIVPRADSPPFL